MPDMTSVDKTSPLWIAWKRYETTEEYANTRRWALHEHAVDGSLWAAFEAGYRAASQDHQTAFGGIQRYLVCDCGNRDDDNVWTIDVPLPMCSADCGRRMRLVAHAYVFTD